MNSSRSARGRVRKLVGVLTAASLLAVLFSSVPTTAQGEEPRRSARAAESATPTPETKKALQEWRRAIARVPMPKKGCFQASYPSKVWKEVRCVTPPQNPYQPAPGRGPFKIGATKDVSAQVTGQQITSATGSFDSVTGVVSETGTTFGQNCATINSNAPDTFSLQLNTGFFDSPQMCQNRGSGCQGLEQFVYSNSGFVFIQYWLAPASPCPNGWKISGPNCFMTGPDSPMVTPLPTIADLVNMSLTGNASSAGDTAVVTVNGMAYGTNTSLGNVLGLSGQGHWNTTEFGVFGDTCGSEAFFNPGPQGSQIVLRTSIQDGTLKAPMCVAQGVTGESNNLSFGPTAPTASGNPPALLVTESSAGGAPSFCAAATSVGDTHLATFGGLAYDFQASGDFLLVQADKGFLVQARQVSGAPSWPNASTNVAVATKMGETRVAICVNPTRLVVDGKPNELGDGKSLSLAGGVDVVRHGETYTITDEDGDSVRATLNNNGQNSWIDVAVGLGHTPQVKVGGLLANALGNVHAIATKNGAVLADPVSFDDLYHTYADSWRVEPAESLLSVCGETKIEPGLPRKPFFAKDLAPKVYERARAVCKAAGIKVKSLLDACTLDVAVIGSDTAAEAFKHLPVPVAVGHLRPIHPDQDR